MNNERPPLYLRPVGVPARDALESLRDARIGAQPVEGAPDVIRLDAGADLGTAMNLVPSVVQDPAAGAVAAFAGPVDGTLVDLCAAPGGKAIVLASGCGTAPASAGFVIGADLSQARMARLAENAHRLAPLRLALVVADGRRPPFRPVGSVLVDAPCTGTGTLRRHADARWRVEPDDLRALTALQVELLDAAADVVRPGGLLVYATCSIEAEENDDQIAAFLDRHTGFEPDPGPRHLEGDIVAAGVDADGRLRLLPHVQGFDGAYAARLRRRR